MRELTRVATAKHAQDAATCHSAIRDAATEEARARHIPPVKTLVFAEQVRPGVRKRLLEASAAIPELREKLKKKSWPSAGTIQKARQGKE